MLYYRLLLIGFLSDRMGSPAELVDRDGVFCDMLQKTGEYDELVQMIRNVE